MAIAGLHNVSVLDSSCLRDSRSQASRRRGGEERRSTRASSLLQMWREFEDEHVVSNSHERDRLREQGTDGVVSDLSSTVISESHGSDHGSGLDDTSVSENESGQWSPNRFGLQNGHEDSGNFNCDRSDLGEVERERVRQIFQEWMNSGARDRASNISHVNHNSRPEWLGETEQERVRIIRGWVQMNSQHRGACAESREEQATEMGDQIEQVLDGLVVNHHSRNEHARRGIRRLCGRQALVDMLKNAEQERQRELQALLEHRAVSNFAHRNRIQSLLRGRFLRNDRMVEDERPRSTAATELGLLRQRHTVSGLREGFFSRLSSCHSDTSSVADINGNRTEQSQVNNLQAMDNFQDQSELNNDENTSHDLSDVRTDIEGDLDENVILQETTIRVEEWQEQVAESEVREWQRSATAEIIESMYDANQVLDEDWRGNTANELSQETLQDEAAEQFHLTEAGEGSYGQPQHAEELAIHGSMDAIEHLESNLIDDVNGQESTANREHWQELVLDEEGELQGAGVESNEWRSGTGDVMEENQEESTANQWPQGHSHPQYGFQEAVRNWLEEPSDPQSFPGGRVDTFYLPDDDNYSMEIRELLSRRRVSNLLQSGFRENLDRLIQSYVERQSHAPVDRELNGTSSGAASAEQDLEQQSRSQNDGQGNAVESPPVALPSTQLPPIQPLWDQDSHNDNWSPHDMHQRFGIEWEMINDLRIDMARLQQRMNNMQRMLEACMDMQVELQRSIRQEVSAALNRSAGSEGMCEDGSPKDGSKWDYVRKGVCCLCCDSNIDSLLYRCGHMCTCSICANELVQSGGKCPMCWAPVVEVIRAYSIL